MLRRSHFLLPRTNQRTPLRELVVAYSPQKVNLDPLHTFTSMESQFFTAIYEGLVVPDPQTLEPTPGVASAWDVSNDGKTYRSRFAPTRSIPTGIPCARRISWRPGCA